MVTRLPLPACAAQQPVLQEDRASNPACTLPFASSIPPVLPGAGNGSRSAGAAAGAGPCQDAVIPQIRSKALLCSMLVAGWGALLQAIHLASF